MFWSIGPKYYCRQSRACTPPTLQRIKCQPKANDVFLRSPVALHNFLIAALLKPDRNKKNCQESPFTLPSIRPLCFVYVLYVEILAIITCIRPTISSSSLRLFRRRAIASTIPRLWNEHQFLYQLTPKRGVMFLSKQIFHRNLIQSTTMVSTFPSQFRNDRPRRNFQVSLWL